MKTIFLWSFIFIFGLLIGDFMLNGQQPQQAQYSVLHLGASSYCPPCRKMLAEVWPKENMKQFLKDNNIKFFDVEIDKNQDYAKIYKIDSVPTIVMVKTVGEKHTQLGRVVGYQTPEKLIKFMQSCIKESESSDTSEAK